jgi:phosphoadenosine phosphosulfate reductase
MKDLFGDKVERAIELLRMYQPKDAFYWGCFSGGKDSCVIKEIARLAGVSVTWHYNVTTIDPPELVRFIKREHGDVVFEIPKMNFFEMAKLKNDFPTRKVRWCCKEFKESRSPIGAILILGVRGAESPHRRSIWKEVTAHMYTHQYAIAPILNWSDDEVWQFIKGRNLPYCKLYDQGFKRIGCVGCPMSSNKDRDFRRWPHFEKRWHQLFHYVWNKKTGSIQRNKLAWFGDKYFDNADEMYKWWRSNDSLPKDDECQGILDMYS